MRAFDQGSEFRVTVSRDEVADFKRRWPNSGLPTRAVSFTYDKENGDLVDLAPFEMDGEASLALSEDAQKYGEKKLGLRTPHAEVYFKDGLSGFDPWSWKGALLIIALVGGISYLKR